MISTTYKIENPSAAIVLLSFAFLNSEAFATTKTLEQGIQQYQLKNYTEAANCFKQASKTEALNPVLHYYYGDCLVELNKQQEAIQEYKRALSLQSEGQLATYCRQALANLSGSASSTQNSEPRIAVPSQSNSAEKLQQQQTEIEAQTEAEIAAEREKTDNQIRIAKEQADRDLASVNTVSLYPQVVGHQIRQYYGQDPTAKGYQDEIKRKLDQQIQSLQADFQRRSQEIHAAGQKRIDGLH